MSEGKRYIAVYNEYMVFVVDSFNDDYKSLDDNGYINIGDDYVKEYYKTNLHTKDVLDNLINEALIYYNNLEEGISKNTNYYGGENNPYEAIKVITAHDLGFCLGNVLKYVLRAGKKNKDTEIQDLEKAKNYIDYRIEELKK